MATFLIVVTALSGCGIIGSSADLTDPEYSSLPVVHSIKSVPYFEQTELMCGPASVATVLTFYGHHTNPKLLTETVYTPARKGSLQNDIVAAARRADMYTFTVRPDKNAVLKLVARNYPVIVLLNLGLSFYEKWHYAVLVGFDRGKNLITLHAGEPTGPIQLSFTTFSSTWARSDNWGLLITPSDRVPPDTTPHEWAEQIRLFSKNNKAKIAEQGLKSALSLWPKDLELLQIESEISYSRNDFKSAERALKKIAKYSPFNAVALNNLADTQIKLGKCREALQSIDRAIMIGDESYQEIFKRTKSEASKRCDRD